MAKKPTMIFIDADAFIGLHVASDIHHQQAVSTLPNLSGTLITSSDVVSEVTTKLSYFTTHRQVVGFLTNILASQVQIEFATPPRLKLASDLFRRQTSKRVSLTDCLNMIIARELGIKKFFSFDRHYLKNGFQFL